MVEPADDLLDAAPCGFLIFGEDGRVERVNSTLLDLLDYRREDVVGQHVERLLTAGTRIFYQTHWFPLLRLHGEAEEIFLMLRSSSGSDVGVLVNAKRREVAGRTGYHCILMRVRERQKFEDDLVRARRSAEQARAEAEKANQAKSAFLAVMSHELRTPLNAIGGYVEILEIGIPGPVNEQQRDILSRISRSKLHLVRLVNEVLDLTRIEAGHVEYDVQDVQLAETVAAVVPMIEPQLQIRGIQLSLEVPEELVVRADRKKTEQILLNLLSNAAKFTPEGGQVSLAAAVSSSRPDRLAISVTDTGGGIPEEKLQAIFEPFVQVDASRTRNAEGAGLGLAISRQLARGMGGDLTAASRAGEGSVFTLSLPTLPLPESRPPGSTVGG